NTFTGGLNVNDGTLNLNKTAGVNAVGSGPVTIGDGVGAANTATLALQASNQMVDTADVVLGSDGRLSMGTSSDAISQISGTGQIDLCTGTINMGDGSTTGGKLTIGGDNSSSTFSGDITGSGTLEKLGSGTLDLNSTTDISYAGSLILSGGTLKLTDIDLTVGNLLITADTVLDFSGASTLFATTFSFLNTSITLNIINWTKNTDFFYATNWTGATQDVLDNMGSLPESQVIFAGWDANNTGWDSWDDQIYPNVPEPSTYGALFLALSAALVLWRKKAHGNRPKA
uniref:PEP-CTERM sorting domain-containing protein n=1 Tax=Cephaloticoccus sp. TaxID=1985742 RepID=UPI00404B549F